jgi:hypothetical protein
MTVLRFETELADLSFSVVLRHFESALLERGNGCNRRLVWLHRYLQELSDNGRRSGASPIHVFFRWRGAPESLLTNLRLSRRVRSSGI